MSLAGENRKNLGKQNGAGDGAFDVDALASRVVEVGGSGDEGRGGYHVLTSRGGFGSEGDGGRGDGGGKGGGFEGADGKFVVEEDGEALVEKLGEHGGKCGGLDQVGSLVEEAAEGDGGFAFGSGCAGHGETLGFVEQDAGFAEDKVFQVLRREEEGEPLRADTRRRRAFDDGAHLAGELGEGVERDGVARREGAEDLADRGLDPLHDVYPAPVEKPPGEGEVLAVDFKIGAVGLAFAVKIAVVVVVLERNGALAHGAGGEGDDRGEVAAAAEEVELDPCEHGQ